MALMMTPLIATLLVLLITAQPKTLQLGEWGGLHARLMVSNTAATLEFDCARGSIAGKIPLNDKGEFEVKGRYSPERGGPVRKGEAQTTVPVTYRGTLRDGSLTLETVGAGGIVIGTFVLTHGTHGRLIKCR